ncbi:MAG: heavy metal resistance protein [Asticcacaulis sp. 32-58-5]|nr:MAG: heavy metal resistance protein [Asticcacaulis sp. 32-58-5]
MTLARSMIITLVLSLLGATLGAIGGAQYVLHKMQRPTPMHELLHRKLHLSEAQKQQIAAMEARHAARKDALETEMRAANADLARAFKKGHAYTPEVQAAIDRFHAAMGDLQKETIQHTFDMRAVLSPEQAAEFDATVVKSLTDAQK